MSAYVNAQPIQPYIKRVLITDKLKKILRAKVILQKK